MKASLKQIFPKYHLWHLRQCCNLYCSIFVSLLWVSAFLMFPFLFPHTVLAALTPGLSPFGLPLLGYSYAMVRSEAEFQHPLFTSPSEILLGEILWLSLDLPY